MSPLTTRERALHTYLRYITRMARPISDVEDLEVRTFCKFGNSVSRNTFKSNLLNVVEIVEHEFKKEFARMKGTILQDGWSNNGTHYVGIFAVYYRAVKVIHNDKVVQNSVIRTPLISVSTMGQVGCDEDETT